MNSNQIPEYSMLSFEMAFAGFYKTVPMYCVAGKYIATLPSGFFATSIYEDEVIGFVDFYWKMRSN